MFVRTDTHVLTHVNTHKWIEHHVLCFSPRAKGEQEMLRSMTLSVSKITQHQSNVYGSVHRKYIPIYIQQDATLHSLFISGNCSTFFGWYLHPSSGTHTTVSTASGICHTVTTNCLYPL